MKSNGSLGLSSDRGARTWLRLSMVGVGVAAAVAVAACGSNGGGGGGGGGGLGNSGFGGNVSGQSGSQSPSGSSGTPVTTGSTGISSGVSSGSLPSGNSSGSGLMPPDDLDAGLGTGADADFGSDTSIGNSGSSGGSGSSGAASGAGGNSGSPGMALPNTETGAPGTPGCGGTLPAMTDYTQNGPFTSHTVDSTGPDGGYTIYEPTTLGANGFKHPIVMWGNGITTTPALYPVTLGKVASNGFVVIASNSTAVTTQDMTGGLDWMIAQNGVAGPYQGKLNTTCLVSMGYSLGGGGAVNAGSHADVVTTVSFHGVTGNSAALKSPLLLFTSVTDNFVTASGFVTPTFDLSDVQTFYATLQMDGDPNKLGHLIPVDILDPNDPERPAAMAWIRYWVYNDQGAAKYFWGGSNALLCKDPWVCQTKNWK